MDKIIVLCGYQASGKDTLATELKKRGFNFIVSHTTRPMRPNECEGNPYYFVTDSEFRRMVKEDRFLEYRTYETKVDNIPATWLYGVTKVAVKKNIPYVVVLDKEGLLEFKKHFPNRVQSYFIEALPEIRKNRAISRKSYNESEYTRREVDDEIEFEGILDIVDGVIVNNNELIDSLKTLLKKVGDLN